MSLKMQKWAMSLVKVSVRHLVEFILRSGSINAGFFMANRAMEG